MQGDKIKAEEEVALMQNCSFTQAIVDIFTVRMQTDQKEGNPLTDRGTNQCQASVKTQKTSFSTLSHRKWLKCIHMFLQNRWCHSRVSPQVTAGGTLTGNILGDQ